MSVTEITSTRALFPDLREAWHHRHLGVMLARRNIKARYMQTLLGSVWIIIQPLLLTGMLTLILGMLLSVPSDGLPYLLFAFTGTIIWSTFQRAVTDTGISLAGSGNIILKVYFPRILIPISSALTALVDLVPVYAVLLLVVAAYGQFPGWPILLSPLFLMLALVMAFAIGLWVTVLDAVFRDMRMVVPSALQLIFYATPVMYSESVAPERWVILFRLNPLFGLIKGFRWSMVAASPPPDLIDVAWSCGFIVLMLAAGLALFARLENFAVDRI
jgi:lipopolysaccharide transport system permease protein